MKRIFYYTFVLLVLAITAQGQFVSTQQKMEEWLTNRFDPNGPGGAVLVVVHGEVIFDKAYGLSNISKNTLLKPDAIFRIGSITKQFTAVAILKLVEAKKISLQDDIKKYIPDYPTHGQKITIEHLLTHTSGIKSYTSMGNLMSKDKKGQEVTPLTMVNAFKNEPMDFTPGEHFLYNNSGYFLLGVIIEKVTKQSWGDYITKNFLKPLNMTTAYTYDPRKETQATGYAQVEGGQFVEADYVHPSIPYAAGALFATTQDLVKWNEAIFSGKVVSKALLEKAFTPLTLNNGEQESYGYGWQLGKIDGHKVIAHGGGIDGFISYALYVPDKKLCVVVLLNSMDRSAEAIAYQLANIQLGVFDKKEPVISVSTDEMKAFTGVYESGKGVYYITYEDGRLYAQPFGGALQALIPTAPNRFVVNDGANKFSFSKQDGVEHLKLEDHNWVDQVYVKTDKPLPKRSSGISYTPEMFDEIEGEYALSQQIVCKIFRDDNRFYTQLTGQPSVEIFPEEKDLFFGKVVDFKIKFNRNESNQVIGLTILQGGRELFAQRGKMKPRIAISVSPEILKRYVGKYQLAPSLVMEITMKEEKLFAQLTGQSAYEIFATSETEFFLKIVDAQLSFKVTGKNVVESLTLYQNGRVITAPRQP
jgi:CubicO group peptidase (beta-lactamase class C family)